MKSYVSPINRCGILESSNEYYAYSLKEPYQFEPIVSNEARRRIHNYEDVEVHEVSDQVSAIKALKSACKRYNALYISLFILDSEIDITDRTKIAKSLPELLNTDPTIIKYLENIFFAQIMPITADVDGAKRICRQIGLWTLDEVLTGADKMQLEISRVRQAWDILPNDQFRNIEDRGKFQAEAVRHGVFLAFAKRIEHPSNLNTLNKFKQPLLLSSITNSSEVFEAWLHSARQLTRQSISTFKPLFLPEQEQQDDEEIHNPDTTLPAISFFVDAVVMQKNENPFEL